MPAIGCPAPGILATGDGGDRGALTERGRWLLGVCGRPSVPDEMLDCLKLAVLAEFVPNDEPARGGPDPSGRARAWYGCWSVWFQRGVMSVNVSFLRETDARAHAHIQ